MTKLYWQQLALEGCPECGTPLSDMIHTDRDTLECSLCSFCVSTDDILGWVWGRAKCRICGEEEVFVAPCTCDFDTMECMNCGNKTCEAFEVNYGRHCM